MFVPQEKQRPVRSVQRESEGCCWATNMNDLVDKNLQRSPSTRMELERMEPERKAGTR